MDILRKSLAPISGPAWEEINETAVDVLTSVLSARKFIDIEGPKGWDYAALSEGRLNVPANQKGDVKYGINQVMPLVESRLPFELNIWELDNAERGCEDIELDNLENAARKIAQFEENIIYEGLSKANIKGLKEASEHKKISFPDNGNDILAAVTKGIAQMKKASIEGPYSLVLNSDKWEKVQSFVQGYPLTKRLENMLGGSIIMAPYVKDAFLVTERGGDFKMVIGQDLSIGYESHNNKVVQLYFTESFTFKILDPKAVLVFE